MPRLVHQNGKNNASIQFHCSNCKKEYITSVENLGKSFSCDCCRQQVNTLPIFCNNKECHGRYRRCGGAIKRLSGEELVAAEKEAFKEEDYTGARPTDDFHDDMRDIRSTIVSYRCNRCSAEYTAAHAANDGYDSGADVCQKIVCDSCRQFPDLDKLLEPDQDLQQKDSLDNQICPIEWSELGY